MSKNITLMTHMPEVWQKSTVFKKKTLTKILFQKYYLMLIRNIISLTV